MVKQIITRQSVIEKVAELEDSLKEAIKIDESFYQELLSDYKVHVWALKSVGDNYPMDKAIDIQEQFDKLESRMPFITGEEVKESVLLNDLLDVLHYPIRR